ncbi:MAG TPA: condensation domain-containing protein, partial [Polyangia bacterium]|nr:condensation domain-containing protein [Polyangia bacterium]
PEMVTLVELDQAAIDRIVAAVPGGAGNVQDIYPLAPLQEGILFHHLLQREGDTYLLPALLTFPSRERLDRFTGALQAVIDRHDILRTAILWEGLPEPVQVVLRSAPMRVETVVCAPDAGSVAEQLKERYQPRVHRLDISQAPLLRGYAAHEPDEDRWLLMLLAHHLVVDHSTLDWLVQETALIQQGRVSELPSPIPFREFVGEARQGMGREAHEAYFRSRFGDLTEPTAPYGLTEVQGEGGAVAEEHRMVEQRVATRVREQARRSGVSAASLLHLAFGMVVARAAGRKDVAFGTVLFGRMQGSASTQRGLGLFINTLPVRIGVGDDGAAASLRATHDQLAELLQHEHASLALAQRASGVPAGTPLFTALLNVRHTGTPDAPAEAIGPAAADADGVEALWSEERTNYPLTLSVDDLGRDFALTVQVAAPVSPQQVCAMMERALEGLVEALEGAPETAVSAIAVLPADEREQVLEVWNATAAAYPEDACIHELIATQAERTPEAVALELDGETVTYRELEARARRVAGVLRGLGVGAGARVAVCAERSVEMIVALVGAMKAGGAYVPLDPTYPSQRLAEMLADSAPVAALTHGPARAALEAALAGLANPVPVIDLDTELP